MTVLAQALNDSPQWWVGALLFVLVVVALVGLPAAALNRKPKS